MVKKARRTRLSRTVLTRYPPAAVGDVVEHWQNVFRATGLALGAFSSLFFCCVLPPSVYPRSPLLSPVASLADKRSALATPAPNGNGAQNPQEAVLPEGTLPDKLVRIPVQEEEGSVASPSPPAE
jgi:hypothetical protein